MEAGRVDDGAISDDGWRAPGRTRTETNRISNTAVLLGVNFVGNMILRIIVTGRAGSYPQRPHLLLSDHGGEWRYK